MIKFKRHPKRKIRREREDDLSMLTGGRPVINVGGSQGSFKQLKRVRDDNSKLKEAFSYARAKVYESRGERLPGVVIPLGKSPYFNGKENDSASSLIFPVPPTPYPQPSNLHESSRPHDGQYTINSVASLVNASQPNKAVSSANPRGILKPARTNRISVKPGDFQYWSIYANTRGIQKPKLATTAYTMNAKKTGNRTSSWKICTSMPMTRTSASLVQREMASTMCSDSNVSSTNSYFLPFVATENIRKHTLLKSVPPTSLLRGIVPPPSPLVPVTPDTNLSLYQRSNYSSCGVHQSEWMDRSKCIGKAPTKQYSMEQIIDILCGFATPDSIMADQLFQPHQSTPSSSSSTCMDFPVPPDPKPTTNSRLSRSQSTKTALLNTTNLQGQNIINQPVDFDDEETSPYFRSVPKKKSVSFRTDSMDNVVVDKFVYDPYSPENCWFGSKYNSNENKENEESNIFETVLPPSNTTQPEGNSIFGHQPSLEKQSSSLPELRGSLLDSPSLCNGIIGACSNVNSSNPAFTITPNVTSLEPQFANSENHSSQLLFPTTVTSPYSPTQLFELGNGNTVGLMDSIHNDTSINAFSASPDVWARPSQEYTTSERLSIPDSQSSLFSDLISGFDIDKTTKPSPSSIFSPSDFEKMHPSWKKFINDLGTNPHLLENGFNFNDGAGGSSSSTRAHIIP